MIVLVDWMVRSCQQTNKKLCYFLGKRQWVKFLFVQY